MKGAVPLIATILLSSFAITSSLNTSSPSVISEAEASGTNRFAVWSDDTPGNLDIFFRRSTDGGATWKPSVNLSTNAGNSLGAQIFVSGTHVYVVWNQANVGDTTFDVFFRHSANDGATWGPKVKISNSGSVDFFEVVRISGSGTNVYVVWDDTDFSDVFFRRSANNGVTWESIVNVSNNAGFSGVIQVAATGSNVYLTWQDTTLSSPTPEVLFKRSTDNGATWQPTKNLSNNAGDSAFLTIAATGSNVYVAWDDNTPGNPDILFKRSTDSGSTWKTTVNLSNNAGDSFKPEIVVSGSNVHVVWNQENSAGTISDIYFRKSGNNGATWGPRIKISSSGDNNLSIPHVSASAGNVYVAWNEYGLNTPEVYIRRSMDNGATWQPIKNLSNNAGASGIVDIVAADSSVYLLWDDTTPGFRDVFFVRSTDNGATWQPIKNLSNNGGQSSVAQVGL